MNKNRAIFNIIFYYIVLVGNSVSYIIYNFKTRKNLIDDTETNITSIFRSLLENNIFINIEMGEPRQIIDIFLRMDTEYFYFSEKPNNSTYSQINDVNSNINNFFDKEKSSSLEITNKSSPIIKNFNNKGNYSNDILYFQTDKDTIKKRISFNLYNATYGNMPGVIGFKIIKNPFYNQYSLIDQLKSNDIINSYFWMINYTSDNEGNLIIGEQPHVFDSTYYREEDLLNAHGFLYQTIPEWGLRFDNITFRNKSFKYFQECLFNYEYNYIKGIEKFEKELDIYFNKSIQNGTCFKENINYLKGPNKFYYCNKEKFKDNMKYFPSLIFEHNEMNYTFELNYKDLFLEKNDKLILMVFFDNIGINWYFGKPFLRKYSFIMNQDTKLIGFYNRKDSQNENKNNNNNVIIKIIVIIVGILLLFILGIIIGKYLFKNNKRPKNVIDDDYEYMNNNIEGKIN